MYTGHTDTSITPFGPQPGGYLIVSAINSVLQDRWIRPVPIAWLLPFLAAAGGITSALWLGVLPFFQAMGILLVGLPSIGILSFAFLGRELPWLFASSAYAVSAIAVFAVRARLEELRARRLHVEYLKAENLAALGTFSASIAHEIKNPLAAILCNAQLAEIQTGDGDKKEMLVTLGFIKEEATRASQTVSSLMKFARQDETPLGQIDVGDRLRRTAAMLQPLLDKSGVEGKFDIPQRELPCLANPDQLHEVIANLVQNAIDAMEASPVKKICLEARIDGEYLAIDVKDSGPGIPEDVRRRLFEPFFTTKPIGKGTGLGLSICHGIIKRHQGELKVSSRVGEGACFSIRLPLAARPAVPLAA
jgi:signal transduction histidine kinase